MNNILNNRKDFQGNKTTKIWKFGEKNYRFEVREMGVNNSISKRDGEIRRDRHWLKNRPRGGGRDE